MRAHLGGRVLVDWAPTAAAEPLVRALARDLLGDDPGPLHHSCPFCGSVEHGRPYVDAAVHVSVAHAGDLTAVAVSTAGPVGVDLEVDADVDWVRREAVGKALGVGIVGAPVEPTWSSDVQIPGFTCAVAVVSDEAARAAVARTARS